MQMSRAEDRNVSILFELEARARIADLVHRYAHGVRARDASAFSGLFCKDAVFELRAATDAGGVAETQSRLEGAAEVENFVARSVQGDVPICPLIHNLLIRVDGDEAQSRCVMVGVRPDGTPMFMGVYEDRYRQEDGWKFSERVFTVSSAGMKLSL